MNTTKGPRPHRFYNHRTPTLVGCEQAWTEVTNNTLIRAKSEAQALRVAYRTFLERMERFRSVLRWLNSKDSTIAFDTACDNASVAPDAARESILKAAPSELIDFLTPDSNHPCPLCFFQPRRIP